MDPIGLDGRAILNDAFHKLDNVSAANVVIATLAPLRQNMQAQVSLVGISGSLEAFCVFLDVSIRQRVERLAAGILTVPAELWRD